MIDFSMVVGVRDQVGWGGRIGVLKRGVGWCISALHINVRVHDGLCLVRFL